MAQSAAALLDSDERLDLRLPSRVPRSARTRPAVDWARLLYYFFGAAAALGFLLYTAERMNPADEELRAQPLADVLGPWDGTWVGDFRVQTMTGEPLESYTASYAFLSSSHQIQTMAVARILEGREVLEEVWVVRVLDESVLQARRTEQPSSDPVVYKGSHHDGQVVLHRETEDFVESHRSWITQNELHVEITHIPRDNPAGTVVTSGELRRTAEPGT